MLTAWLTHHTHPKSVPSTTESSLEPLIQVLAVMVPCSGETVNRRNRG